MTTKHQKYESAYDVEITTFKLDESFNNLEKASLKIKEQRDDLLKACKEALETFEYQRNQGEKIEGIESEYSCEISLRNAIAKAEGKL